MVRISSIGRSLTLGQGVGAESGQMVPEGLGHGPRLTVGADDLVVTPFPVCIEAMSCRPPSDRPPPSTAHDAKTFGQSRRRDRRSSGGRTPDAGPFVNSLGRPPRTRRSPTSRFNQDAWPKTPIGRWPPRSRASVARYVWRPWPSSFRYPLLAAYGVAVNGRGHGDDSSVNSSDGRPAPQAVVTWRGWLGHRLRCGDEIGWMGHVQLEHRAVGDDHGATGRSPGIVRARHPEVTVRVRGSDDRTVIAVTQRAPRRV